MGGMLVTTDSLRDRRRCFCQRERRLGPGWPLGGAGGRTGYPKAARRRAMGGVGMKIGVEGEITGRFLDTEIPGTRGAVAYRTVVAWLNILHLF